MRHLTISFVMVLLVVVTTSSTSYGQYRHTNFGLFGNASILTLPNVENNGALKGGGVGVGVGVGMFLKFDGTEVSGDINYFPKSQKLFTVGGRIGSELPIKGKSPVENPFSAGFSYRMFVSTWELHALETFVSYDFAKAQQLYFAVGVTTSSIKEQSKGLAFVNVSYRYKFGGRN